MVNTEQVTSYGGDPVWSSFHRLLLPPVHLRAFIGEEMDPHQTLLLMTIYLYPAFFQKKGFKVTYVNT